MNFLFDRHRYGPSHKYLGQTNNVLLYFSLVKKIDIFILFLCSGLEEEVMLKHKQTLWLPFGGWSCTGTLGLSDFQSPSLITHDDLECPSLIPPSLISE